jgi:ATP phosphoribosyltransferase
MEQGPKLQIAIQKSWRLGEKSLELLQKAGLAFDNGKSSLKIPCSNFPVDLILLRDDDIPEYVNDGFCDLGIVGKNVYEEQVLKNNFAQGRNIDIALPLGFGKCRLSIAFPVANQIKNLGELENKILATTYPEIVKKFLITNAISNCRVVKISGSVEVAPELKLADGICDLVSTGSTLQLNGLKELFRVFESEAVLIQKNQQVSNEKIEIRRKLLERIRGILNARSAKYVMMNAPKDALAKIIEVLPGREGPTIMELSGEPSKVAIHVVSYEEVFWETIEKLKACGASSILVLPIEKMID